MFTYYLALFVFGYVIFFGHKIYKITGVERKVLWFALNVPFFTAVFFLIDALCKLYDTRNSKLVSVKKVALFTGAVICCEISVSCKCLKWFTNWLPVYNVVIGFISFFLMALCIICLIFILNETADLQIQ